MKRIRFRESWFEVGDYGYSVAKFVAGQHYPVTPETTAHAERGTAEVIEVDELPAPPLEAAVAAIRKLADRSEFGKVTALLDEISPNWNKPPAPSRFARKERA